MDNLVVVIKAAQEDIDAGVPGKAFLAKVLEGFDNKEITNVPSR